MADIWFDVDTALAEVPVNMLPLLDDADAKTIEDAVAYNAAGLALNWHFVTSAGAYTVTAVTPTTAGAYDWTDTGTSGVYTIEIPASGGASINNDTEGYGWFTGVATGVLPWRSPIYGFRAAAINDSLCDTNTTGLLAPTTAGRTLDVTATGAAGIDWGNVENPTTAVNLSATNIDADQVVASVSGAVGSVTGHTPQTGDAYARLGAPAGASVSADVAAIKAETATIVADTGELQTDWANGGRLDLLLDTAAAGGAAASYGIVHEGTAQSATGTTLVLASGAAFADDELIGATILITGGTGVGQARTITDYVGATDTATVDTWTTTPSGTITYKVFGTPPASATAVPAVNLVQVGGSTTDVSALATNVAAILVDTGTTLPATLDTIDNFLDTEIAAILADTNELQTDWANGGRLDLLLDGAASAGDPWTTALPGAYSAGTAGYIIGTDLASVLADTNELQTDWANGGRLDLLLDGAASAGDPWTTALPGAYGSGTAGKIIGDNINATISSRASQTSVDTVDDLLDTEVAAIKTVVDAVKVKTDQLAFTAANKVDANVLNVNSQSIGASKPYDTAS
jgi:hypothetical protein